MTKRILNLSTFKLLNIIVILIAMTSCHHKELCYVHPHSTKIRVVYDWRDAPNASPAGMCAFFYSIDRDGDYRRFDFPGAKEGEIELPVGKYVLITYNNDTEAVQFFGQQTFDGHSAYTRNGDILEPMFGNGIVSSVRGDDDERVVITPDDLFGCTATEIEITDHGVRYTWTRGEDDEVRSEENDDQIITLYPHDMLCHYTYEVRNVKNIKHIAKVSGAISGMSGALSLSDEQLDMENITLPVPAQANTNAQTITGEFLTFGHHEANNAPHAMSFYVVMDDGAKYSFKVDKNPHLDVTEQVHSAPDRRNVHLIIDGIELPTPIENGNGFSPEVEDWGVIEEDVDI